MKRQALPASSCGVLLLVIVSLMGRNASAQLYRGAQTVRTAQTPPPSTYLDTISGYRFHDSIEAKLVRLALDGPRLRSAQSQGRINEYQLKGAKNNILNLLTLSLNYNDQSFAKPSAINSTAYVYPKYFFGFVFPLGTVFSRTQVKAAREQVKMSKENEEQLIRTIRSEVLAKYRQYKVKTEQVKLQIQVADDEQASFLQVQKSFRDGTVTLEIHNTAQKKYNEEITKKMNLQLELDILRLDLEQMIGTNLENVL